MTAEQPDYAGFRITSLWAYTMVGEDDEEGVLGFLAPDGEMPMIASDRVRLDQLRPYAQSVARAAGRPATLVRFDQRTDLEVLQP